MTWLPTSGVLQDAPRVQAQDRAPLQWTGAVTTHTYLPTKSLEDVVPLVRPQFEALLAHAASLGLKPKIRSAGRTCEEQAEQVKLGFSSADLCRSMHVLGHAVDLDLTPNDCATHTKLGTWWEGRGGVWGGRWTGAKFGPCGDMGHYHFGFGGAGAVPTATCPADVTLAECRKIRSDYLLAASSAGPGVSSGGGLLAAVGIVAAGAAFLWAATHVRPGALVARENPVITLRQIQDFKNGYAEGYREARHGEIDVEGRSPSEEHRAGVVAGLKDGRRGKNFQADLRRASSKFFTAARENPARITLYHGTTESWARRATEQGFRRTYEGGPAGRWTIGSALRLTLTDSLPVARFYAALRAWVEEEKRGGVLAVRVDPAGLRPDLGAYYYLNMRRDPDKKIATARDGRASLREVGAATYARNVPREDVELVELVPAKHRFRITDPRPLVREALRS